MGFSLRSSRIASVGLASVIAVGIIGASSVALADEPGSGTPSGQAERRAHPIKLGIASVLKDSGVTREELKEGAGAGLTLGQIIDQYGDVSAAQAKANALTAIAARLDEAVTNGNLTQEKADAIEAKAPELIDRLLNAVPGKHRDGGEDRGGKVRSAAKHSLETVAEVLGTDVATLRDQLKLGQTIADIAGPQTQAVIDALVADANTAIDKAVADGKLPAEKADTAKERAAAAIARFVNEGRAGRGQHGPANSQ